MHDKVGQTPRITVLDARELDQEIFNILKNQLHAIINNLPVEITYFEPELQTVLKIALWMLSVQRNSASFGQQLLRIKYFQKGSLRNLRLLGLVQIGAFYFKQRLSEIISLFQRKSTSDLGLKVVEWSELLVNVVNVIYFIKFLRHGGASSFVEYILGLKLVSSVSSTSRNIGYSFMTRELIWHALIELMVLVIPMINYHALKRRFKKYTKFNAHVSTKENLDLTKDSMKCAVCKDNPVLPHHMGCCHLFCYYCLVSHRLADKKFECPICGYSNPDASTIPLSLKW